MSIDAIKYTKSATVERAQEMLKRLHDRNQRTWDDLDRDVAFAIEALIASAERYRFIANKMQAEQAQPVAWLYLGSETEAKHVCLDEDIFEEQKPNCIPLYTAPPQRQPLTDDQCDAIATALDDWALNADSYDYGLPIHNEGQLEKARAIIRAAIAKHGGAA